MNSNTPCQQAVRYFETLAPATLPDIGRIYAPDAWFVDPFNDVRGLPLIRRVYEHMFATLQAPRFEVLNAISEGEHSFLVWDFHFQSKVGAQPSLIHGATHLRFGADGRITLHRDYWDPAREIYEGVPLLGALMRALRRRLATPAR